VPVRTIVRGGELQRAGKRGDRGSAVTHTYAGFSGCHFNRYDAGSIKGYVCLRRPNYQLHRARSAGRGTCPQAAAAQGNVYQVWLRAELKSRRVGAQHHQLRVRVKVHSAQGFIGEWCREIKRGAGRAGGFKRCAGLQVLERTEDGFGNSHRGPAGVSAAGGKCERYALGAPGVIQQPAHTKWNCNHSYAKGSKCGQHDRPGKALWVVAHG